MKLINIYLIGQIYICNIYIRSTSPIKYMAWNNEIISWDCVGYVWMHDVCSWISKIWGTGNGYGVLWKLLGIVYGIIVVCLIYDLLPQQNKK